MKKNMPNENNPTIFNDDFYENYVQGESNPFANVDLSEKDKQMIDKLTGAAYAKEKRELEEKRAEIEQLREQLAVNDLTHLLKWRSEMAQQMVERYLDEAGRHGHEVWFGIFDIDILKYLNDTYGYYKSDHVIKLFADTLNKSLRRSDTCYQFGVDEFPVLLIGVDQENLKTVLGRITDNFESGLNELVETGAIPKEMADKCSFSGGFVKAQVEEEYQKPRGSRLESAQNLFERSEQFLHNAKRNGRNSVAIEGVAQPQVLRKIITSSIETLIDDSEELKERYLA